MESKNSINNLWESLSSAIEDDDKNKPLFSTPDYKTFEIDGIEFIKFRSTLGRTPIMTKNIMFDIKFGDSNNLSEAAELLESLSGILDKVERFVGSENVLSFETDLTAHDGLKDYGTFVSKISLPTFDFIRANAEVLERYNPGEPYWTATPFSTSSRGYSRSVCYVSSIGVLSRDSCGCTCGVRPFLMLDSCIFEE